MDADKAEFLKRHSTKPDLLHPPGYPSLELPSLKMLAFFDWILLQRLGTLGITHLRSKRESRVS